MDFIFCGKTGYEFEMIRDRKSKGFQNVELYTDKNTFDLDHNEILSNLKKNDMNCLIVHAPHYITTPNNAMDCGVGSLDKLVRTASIDLILKTIELASNICTDKRFVVIHPGGFLKSKTYTFTSKEIESANEESVSNAIQDLKILIKHAEEKNVYICLENMPIIIGEKNNHYRSVTCFSYLEDYYTLFNEIKSEFMMATVDTCHLISQARMLGLMFAFNKTLGSTKDTNIENCNHIQNSDCLELELIKSFLGGLKDKIGVIHLNNAIEFGLTRQTHSTMFVESDTFFLKQIFSILKSIKYENPITLEINVKNLFNAVEAQDTYNLIKNIL